MARKTWVYDPQSGGITIPPQIQARIRQRVLAHAEKHYAGKHNRIEVRFRGQFCYIDAYPEPYVPKDYDRDLYGESRQERIERLRNMPTHLCRLRYFGDEDRWSMAFYTYSHEAYEPSVFDNGSWHGTPEEAFDTSAVYLDD
ncbi:MAG: hypothetical protein FJ280_10410 [Planctomycetes bacterium]|nr:hypothetical protein [Planctomycetota bacterium]